MTTAISVILMIASLVIVLSVTAQEPKTQGMGTLGGQETNVFGKGAHKSKDERLDKFIIAGGIVIFICSIILNAIN
ncbi:MAG: preprotein translocase subunit SecG [Tissierellia bacterium]|nr:preprotein translocase subunit SecG [Tissierellia bacterium]